MRILIVEDEKDWQEIIQNAFQNQNHKIVGVYDNTSTNTYQAILDKKPDILVMDIQLEYKEAGIEFVKKLNQHPNFEETSIVFLTSLNEEYYFNKAFEAHSQVAHYVEKTNFVAQRAARTVREITKYAERNKPPYIFVHGKKVYLNSILWVEVDKEYEKETNKKRLAIVCKDHSGHKEVTYAYGANLKEFTDYESRSPLYAKGKLEYISKAQIANFDNALRLTHPAVTDFYVLFDFAENTIVSLKMSKRYGRKLYAKYMGRYPSL
jgi:CheY-like chemotaxis protein